jgi:hypothetical protein
MTGGSHLSARNEKEKERRAERGERAEVCFGADRAGWVPGTAQVGLLAFSSYFFCAISFLIFCFLISFLDFAKLLQMNSNHFQKFCKIQDKVLNQQQTCFQNQNKIFIKRS